MSESVTCGQTTIQSISELEERVEELHPLEREIDTSGYVLRTISLKREKYKKPKGTRKQRDRAERALYERELRRIKRVYDSLVEDPRVDVLENPAAFPKRGYGFNPYYCSKIHCNVGGERVVIGFSPPTFSWRDTYESSKN